MSVNKHKLISAIYAATLSPKNFNKIFDDLDEAIFGAEREGILKSHLEDGAQSEAVKVDPDLLYHIEAARQMQGSAEREKVSRDPVLTLIEAVPNPSYLIDAKGKIIACNDLARSKYDEQPTELGDCVREERARADILNYISNSKNQNLSVIPGYEELDSEHLTSILIKKIEEQLIADQGEDNEHFLLTIVDFGFDQNTIDLFRQSYGLTVAEAEVAVLLSSGMQHAEIAERRDVSLQTIRTQVKTIKSKTNVRDIPALVRLLCGFSVGILVPTQLLSSNDLDVATLKSKKLMTLSDGRKLEYLEQGASDGAPVLILHNMPYGAELPKAAIHAAARLNLRFIAPYRPGYGGSDSPAGLKRGELLDQTASDHKELLDYLGIPSAILLGQTIGIPYALRFATLYPEKVETLLGVSYAPMWRDEWLSRSPKRHRMLMQIARILPQLLPLMIRVMIKCMEAGYGRQLIQHALSDSQADLKAFDDPEVANLLIASCDTGLAQGAEAFSNDLILTVTDFSAEAKECSHKFHILHGDDDAIVNRKNVEAFLQEVPGSKMDEVQGAGQLLIYSHWESILGLICKKLQEQEAA